MRNICRKLDTSTTWCNCCLPLDYHNCFHEPASEGLLKGTLDQKKGGSDFIMDSALGRRADALRYCIGSIASILTLSLLSCFLTVALNWLCFLLAQLESPTPAPCWSPDSSEGRISGQRGLSAPRKPKPLRWGRFYLLTTSGNCASVCPRLLCGEMQWVPSKRC